MADRPSLFLIDGSSQMYRAYHAFRGTGLSNQEGASTHAVLVFVTMLRKLIADHQPVCIAASFDLSGPTFRDEIVDDYKANREAMPADLAEQIASVHESCEALGVPIVTAVGYEADDVIGTLTRRAVTEGFEVAVVSIDKDFFQLVGDHVRVYDPREDGTWYDPDGVVAKFGVKPSQVIDVLSLVGDTSDNVAGVPGIGKKGAIDLITRFGSLDALLEQVDALKPKQREALTTHRDAALRSRRLVTIHTDVPLALDLEALRYTGPDRQRCYDLFSRLGFRTLSTEFAPTADAVQKNYALVRTTADLDELVAGLRRAGEFACHVVTDGPVAMRAGILGLVFSTADREARYVPLGHVAAGGGHDLLGGAAPDQLRRDETLRALQPVFEDATIPKTGHDLKTATIVLERHGIRLSGVRFDSMLAAYLLDATRPGHALETTALEHLGYRARNVEDLCGRGARAVPLDEIAPDALLDYAGERADLPRQLAAILAPRLSEARLDHLYADLELPLVPVLAAVERAGVRLDVPALQAQSQRIEQELSSLAARIYEAAGETFNINSPKQLGEILFEKLALPTLKKTGKTRSASTAVDVLEELALTHDLPRLILEWRSLSKLKGTYIDALPALVHPGTGRVHTSFNQAVAATGRLSSSDPNLQNIPVRTPAGREIRRAFIAEDGHVLISADYSQIELRVLAHMAGEEALIEAFRSGEDIHDRTALRLFGPPDDAPGSPDRHERRSRSKMVNYAVLYGKTPFTLARDINVSQETAQAFIDAYFTGFPRVRAFIDRTLEEARLSGEVRTMDGRRRLVPNLTSRNFQLRAQSEREAVNMPIQGSAADILKRAMIALHGELPRRGLRGRMILTVHDELLFECPEGEAEETARVVRDQMERAAALNVPLTVDVGIGRNWKDAKP